MLLNIHVHVHVHDYKYTIRNPPVMFLQYLNRDSIARLTRTVCLLCTIPRVYNKEGGRMSYSSIVPCTAVVRVEAKSMIFTMCGVIVGSRIRIVT